MTQANSTRAQCRSGRSFSRGLAAAVLFGLGSTAQAVTIDFRPGYSGNPANNGNWGNSLSFTAGGISVTARGYAATGSLSSGWNLFQTSQIYKWSTGLGNCNRSEGLANSSCNDNEHEFDTVGYDDLLVLVFNQTVNFQSLTVDPYDGPDSDPNDTDIIYWVGNNVNLANLTSRTFNTLATMPGLGAETWLQTASTYNPVTHGLSGTGNVLFVAGNWHDTNCKNANVTYASECEAYKIRDVTVTPYTPQQVVPVPAAVWLFGSGAMVLGMFRRRPAGHG